MMNVQVDSALKGYAIEGSERVSAHTYKETPSRLSNALNR